MNRKPNDGSALADIPFRSNRACLQGSYGAARRARANGLEDLREGQASDADAVGNLTISLKKKLNKGVKYRMTIKAK